MQPAEDSLSKDSAHPDGAVSLEDRFDHDLGGINTENVHRSHFLSGHPHGSGLVHDEMMVAPRIGEIAR
jgi:hypothetical protein